MPVAYQTQAEMVYNLGVKGHRGFSSDGGLQPESLACRYSLQFDDKLVQAAPVMKEKGLLVSGSTDMCNRSQASRSCVQDVRGGSEIKGPVCKASLKENQSVVQNPLNSELGCGTLYGSGIFHGSERLTENSLANSLSNADGNCSSPSSSIGANSSCTSVEDSLSGTPDEEVESRLRSPLEGMASLGAFLPPRKGLSRFIEGKSRSFTCLADIRSIKDLAKAENPYARRRRFSNHSIDTLERSRYLPPRNSACGISKKSLCSSRTNLALALVMSSKEKGTEDENWDPCRLSRGIAERSTPRSFSMADLQKTGFTFPASKTL